MSKIIYTKHARERIDLRRLSKTSIEDTILHPGKSFSEADETYKFIKKQGTRTYHVVAQYLPDQKAWLVISAWVRGEDDPQNWLWWLITAPFRLLWWLFKMLFGFGSKK
ncbi:DUF4258 domain-containing protein [bacterium]|nr:DUF4258 domain-containing protein [bacterium]